MKILFTGGGSGGHIIPIVALTREIRKIYFSEFKQKDPRRTALQFFHIGPKDDFSSIFLSQEEIKTKEILAGKIRRYSGFKNIVDNFADIFFKIPLGILQAFYHIFLLNPDLIFSKGGFGSLPAVIAGKFLFVPIFMHESDVAPGMANKFISRFASEIFVSFPKTEYFPIKKMVLVGNPVRKEILQGSKEEAKEFFKLTSEKPVILILGGSQGAQRINDKIIEILPEFLKNFEIIHQCGEKNFQDVKARAKIMMSPELEKYYHLFGFFQEPELRKAYAAADLIVSRAGSGSIFEIASAGLPSVLIPLPESAQNHQVKNAYAYKESGACLIIEEANFTPHFFLEKLRYLFSYPEELEKMKKSANDFAKPRAGHIIAAYILEYLTK